MNLVDFSTRTLNCLQRRNCARTRLTLLSLAAIVAMTIIAVGCSLPASAATTAPANKTEAQAAGNNWVQTFDGGFSNASLNTATWNIADARPGGYQGCCLATFGSQAFTTQDVSLNQGALRITSEKKSSNGKSYTSGAVTTDNKFSFLYGRVDVSARLPKGQGMWPAFWLLTANGDHEIDIMEMINTPTMVYQTYHVNTPSYNTSVSQCKVPQANLSTAFHTYSVIWSSASITWYIDGAQTCQVTKSVPNTPMYLLLDTAVGGTWPGQPDATTVFPQYTDVSSVHVYQSAPATSCLGLQVTSPLQMQSTTAAAGKTMNAAVTYTNKCNLPFALNTLMVSARTSTGGNADFGNPSGAVTLQPGASLTIKASRVIKSTDPTGQWYAFSSFQTADGVWHADGTNLVNFTVTN